MKEHVSHAYRSALNCSDHYSSVLVFDPVVPDFWYVIVSGPDVLRDLEDWSLVAWDCGSNADSDLGFGHGFSSGRNRSDVSAGVSGIVSILAILS